MKLSTFDVVMADITVREDVQFTSEAAGMIKRLRQMRVQHNGETVPRYMERILGRLMNILPARIRLQAEHTAKRHWQ